MGRWDDLFADLAAQAAAADAAERAAEAEERARVELGQGVLADRLRGAEGVQVTVHVTGARLAGVLGLVGPDWLLLDERDGREVLVPLAALLGVDGLGRLTAPPGSVDPVTAKLGLRHALRGIARDRSGVRLHLSSGEVLAATLDRVGADYLEAALHPAGEARRSGAVRSSRAVPFAALAAVRREV